MERTELNSLALFVLVFFVVWILCDCLYSGHHQYDLFGLGEWCSAESYVLVLFENRDQYLGCLTSTFETEVSKVF